MNVNILFKNTSFSTHDWSISFKESVALPWWIWGLEKFSTICRFMLLGAYSIECLAFVNLMKLKSLNVLDRYPDISDLSWFIQFHYTANNDPVCNVNLKFCYFIAPSRQCSSRARPDWNKFVFHWEVSIFDQNVHVFTFWVLFDPQIDKLNGVWPKYV